MGPTKHRTDRTDHTDRTGREIAAGKAQINYRDLVINLYTAYHAMHDEFSQKFYRSSLTTDGRPARENDETVRCFVGPWLPHNKHVVP